jgi:hypothetical protein
MTEQQKILHLLNLLDIAIEYIDTIADKDSETLAYLVEQYKGAASWE